MCGYVVWYKSFVVMCVVGLLLVWNIMGLYCVCYFVFRYLVLMLDKVGVEVYWYVGWLVDLLVCICLIWGIGNVFVWLCCVLYGYVFGCYVICGYGWKLGVG